MTAVNTAAAKIPIDTIGGQNRIPSIVPTVFIPTSTSKKPQI